MTLHVLGQGPATLAHSHAAFYGGYPSQRPIIEVEMAVTDHRGMLVGRPVRTTFIVDSGADLTLADGGLASTLGVDLSDSQYPTDSIGGIGAGGVPYTLVVVRMELCDRWIEVPVGFTTDGVTRPNLLGRLGAFDALILSFIHGNTVLLAAAV